MKTNNTQKSPRHMLFVWGIGEILLALCITFFWHTESGIFYWITDIVFSILLLFGLLSIKDGIFASDKDILKKVSGESRDNFELKTKNSFISILRKINGAYHIFLICTIVFMILHFTSFYIPEKSIVEGIFVALMIIFGIPVLMYW